MDTRTHKKRGKETPKKGPFTIVFTTHLGNGYATRESLGRRLLSTAATAVATITNHKGATATSFFFCSKVRRFDSTVVKIEQGQKKKLQRDRLVHPLIPQLL